MSEALRLAELLTNLKITVKGRDNAEAMEEAAAELRRLHQSEREGWRWADELEQERKRLHDLVTEDSILQRRQRDEIAQLGQALARAIERNNELEAELAGQARLVGMGSEREARLFITGEQK